MPIAVRRSTPFVLVLSENHTFVFAFSAIRFHNQFPDNQRFFMNANTFATIFSVDQLPLFVDLNRPPLSTSSNCQPAFAVQTQLPTSLVYTLQGAFAPDSSTTRSLQLHADALKFENEFNNQDLFAATTSLSFHANNQDLFAATTSLSFYPSSLVDSNNQDLFAATTSPSFNTQDLFAATTSLSLSFHANNQDLFAATTSLSFYPSSLVDSNNQDLFAATTSPSFNTQDLFAATTSLSFYPSSLVDFNNQDLFAATTSPSFNLSTLVGPNQPIAHPLNIINSRQIVAAHGVTSTHSTAPHAPLHTTCSAGHPVAKPISTDRTALPPLLLRGPSGPSAVLLNALSDPAPDAFETFSDRHRVSPAHFRCWLLFSLRVSTRGCVIARVSFPPFATHCCAYKHLPFIPSRPPFPTNCRSFAPPCSSRPPPPPPPIPSSHQHGPTGPTRSAHSTTGPSDARTLSSNWMDA